MARNVFTDCAEEHSCIHALPEQSLSNKQEAVANILMSKCCSKECLLFLSGHVVLTPRKRVCPLNRSAVWQWLTDEVSESSHYANGKLETKFGIGGIEVCRMAFCQVYSLNSKMFLVQLNL